MQLARSPARTSRCDAAEVRLFASGKDAPNATVTAFGMGCGWASIPTPTASLKSDDLHPLAPGGGTWRQLQANDTDRRCRDERTAKREWRCR